MRFNQRRGNNTGELITVPQYELRTQSAVENNGFERSRRTLLSARKRGVRKNIHPCIVRGDSNPEWRKSEFASRWEGQSPAAMLIAMRIDFHLLWRLPKYFSGFALRWNMAIYCFTPLPPNSSISQLPLIVIGRRFERDVLDFFFLKKIGTGFSRYKRTVLSHIGKINDF